MCTQNSRLRHCLSFLLLSLVAVPVLSVPFVAPTISALHKRGNPLTTADLANPKALANWLRTESSLPLSNIFFYQDEPTTKFVPIADRPAGRLTVGEQAAKVYKRESLAALPQAGEPLTPDDVMTRSMGTDTRIKLTSALRKMFWEASAEVVPPSEGRKVFTVTGNNNENFGEGGLLTKVAKPVLQRRSDDPADDARGILRTRAQMVPVKGGGEKVKFFSEVEYASSDEAKRAALSREIEVSKRPSGRQMPQEPAQNRRPVGQGATEDGRRVDGLPKLARPPGEPDAVREPAQVHAPTNGRKGPARVPTRLGSPTTGNPAAHLGGVHM